MGKAATRMRRRGFVAGLLGACAARGEPVDLRPLEREIAWRINELRKRVSAPPLTWDDAVAAAARNESEDMARIRFFSHENPERGELAARLDSAGIRWLRCGENILREDGFLDPVSVAEVEWWYSPGHKANLINPVYTHTGVGLARGSPHEVFATQIFVLPLPPGVRMRRQIP